MVSKRIIYPNDNGGISIIIPTESVDFSIKDVPQGKPYKIVDVSDLPSDRTFRNAWTADFSESAIVEEVSSEVAE